MKDLPIIALDFESATKVNTFLDQFDEPLFVKIGMELFYQAGPDLIKSIKSRGHDIFLDLSYMIFQTRLKSNGRLRKVRCRLS